MAIYIYIYIYIYQSGGHWAGKWYGLCSSPGFCRYVPSFFVVKKKCFSQRLNTWWTRWKFFFVWKKDLEPRIQHVEDPWFKWLSSSPGYREKLKVVISCLLVHFTGFLSVFRHLDTYSILLYFTDLLYTPTKEGLMRNERGRKKKVKREWRGSDEQVKSNEGLMRVKKEWRSKERLTREWRATKEWRGSKEGLMKVWGGSEEGLKREWKGSKEVVAMVWRRRE